MFILTFNYETPPVYFPFTDYQNQIRFFKYNFWTTGPEVPFSKNFLGFFVFSSPTPAFFRCIFSEKHTIMNYSICFCPEWQYHERSI